MWVSLVAGIVSIITPLLSYIPFPSDPTVVEAPVDDSRHDPFPATLYEEKSKGNLGDGLAPLVKKVTTYLGPGQKLSILIVMTAEDVEARIRDRRAVEAAINLACFSREKSDDLVTYFKFLLNRRTSVIPYEWHEKISLCGGSKYEVEHLLVLWMKTSDYQGQTLAGVDELLAKILLSNHQQPNVKIIGPRNSSEFRNILKEIETRLNSSHSIRNNVKLELYSPWATAMPSLLSLGLKDPNGHPCESYDACEKVFYRLLKAGGLELRHSISSDAVLVDALLEELLRRGVTVGKDSIALIGNWNSMYAKALYRTFSAAACHNISRLVRSGSCQSTQQGVDLIETGEFGITQYSYTGAGDKYDKEAFVSLIKSNKPRAIGILATDPNDTLSLLGDLKKEFPGVLFFTTDLDFKYIHDSEQKQTRNLIVVSQFGLQLAPSLQQSIHPFRSSLQTSTFFAVLQAIGRVAPWPHNHTIPPRIFEIGRHGAVDLSITEWPMNVLPTIHPVRTDVDRLTGRFNLPPKIGLLWIVGLTLGFLALWGNGRLWNWLAARDKPVPSRQRLTMVLRSATIFFPILWAFWALNIGHFNYDKDEPFSWSDGVSIWPTELLRIVAIVLCSYFFILSRLKIDNSMRELTARFFSAEIIIETKKTWQNGVGGFWQSIDWIGHGLPAGQSISAADLWTRYREAHRWNHRVGRVMLWYLIYLSTIGLALTFLTDEVDFFVPCRGFVSCSINHLIATISILFLVFLSFTVLDSVCLCIRWVNEVPDTTGLNANSARTLLAVHAQVVKGTITYPLIVVVMLLGARSEYFDNWHFSSASVAGLSLTGLILIGSGLGLQLAGTKARRKLMGGKRSEGTWTPQGL